MSSTKVQWMPKILRWKENERGEAECPAKMRWCLDNREAHPAEQNHSTSAQVIIHLNDLSYDILCTFIKLHAELFILGTPPIMRLLHLRKGGAEFSLVERIGNDIPPYAILSHTWGADGEEVTFKDLIERGQSIVEMKLGYCKLEFCCRQAARDGLDYCWVDTCCIDKSSSAELSEAGFPKMLCLSFRRCI
jgi:hypothetical protein